MLNLRPLPEDLQKIAIEQLSEVPERLEDDIKALREWIEKQPYLTSRTDDQFLVSFLRGCKFSLEKAKSKIDRFWTLRTQDPEFYLIKNVDDPRVLHVIRIGFGVYLPTPLHGNGPRIMFVRPGNYPADEYDVEEIMSVNHGIVTILMLEDDYANVNGIIGIVDMTQMSMAHMFQMTPTLIRKISTFSEEALPIRQKGTHILNSPAAWDTIFNTIKPLLPKKQQERMYIHGNRMDSLYEHIPQKYLPKEYGGENGSIEEIISKNEAMYLSYRNSLKEDMKYGTDESLRPKNLEDYGIFGAEGSFRQLNVD